MLPSKKQSMLCYTIQMMDCKIMIGVEIESYNNINGTSYKPQGSARKCCDGADRPDCTDGDTCDTYFSICI